MMDDLIVFGANSDPDKLRFNLDPEFIVWMETTFFQGLIVQNLKHRQIMVMLYCACACSARDTPDQ